MNLELIPLLIVALLMISAGGAEVETAELVMEGTHEISEHRGALIVGDATVTIPADAEVSGPIYVIGGELRIQGSVTGDVTQLSGVLTVEDGGAIDDELLYVAGTERIASGAQIGERTTTEITRAQSDPVAAYVPSALLTIALALGGGWIARKRPRLLNNVGTAAVDHTVVSLTVGALVFVTFLAVFVFMAFTLVLIPVSILGLFVGLLTIAYGVLAWGYIVGKRVETSRPDVATGIGVVAVMILLHLAGFVPMIGEFVTIGILLTGLGATVVTYFGLSRFEPAVIPE